MKLGAKQTTAIAKQRFPLLILAMLLLMSLNGSAYADGFAEPVDNKDIELQVVVGFDNRIKTGFWTPIQVTATNKGPDLRGQLQLRIPGMGEQDYLYKKEVILPQGTTKVVELIAPLNGEKRRLDLELVQDGKVIDTVRTERIQPYGSEDIFIGVFAADRNTFNGIKSVRFDNRGYTRVFNFNEQDFPQAAVILKNFDVIVLNNFDIGSLTNTQRTALANWVNDGGILLLGAGPQWQKTLAQLPVNLLPVVVDGTRNVTALPELAVLAQQALPAGTFTVSTGSVQKGNVLAKEGNNPLVVAADVGRGKVYYFALDFALAPLAGWAGNNTLWKGLLNQHLQPRQWESNSLVDGRFNWLTRNIPSLDLPAPWLILAIIGVYLLLIGPLNYYLLKRMDKRDWTWVTLPVIACVFTLGIFGLGAKDQGGTMLLNNISLINLNQDGTDTTLRSYVGLFASNKKEYAISFAEQDLFAAPLPAEEYYQGGISPQNNAPRPVYAEVTQGGTLQIDFKPTSMWTMRNFYLEQSIAKPGRIEADLLAQDGKIIGKITNKTKYPMDDCLLVAFNEFTRFGPLTPGETKQVVIDLNKATANKSYYKQGIPLFARIYQLPGYGAGPAQNPTKMPTPAQRRDLQRGNILQSVFGYEGEMLRQQTGVMFIGWSEEQLQTIKVNGQKPRVYTQNLFAAPLAIRYVHNGRFEIPMGLVTGQLESANARECSVNPDGINLFDGEAVFTLTIPVEGNLKVEELAVRAIAYPGNRIDGEVYNWQQDQWVGLGQITTERNLQNIDQYLQNKTVKIKVKTQDKGGFFMNQLSLRAKGVIE